MNHYHVLRDNHGDARSFPRRAQIRDDASGKQALTLQRALELSAAFFEATDAVTLLEAALSPIVTPLRDVLGRHAHPRAAFEAARLAYIEGTDFPVARMEAASAAGSRDATHALWRRTLEVGEQERAAALAERLIDQGYVYQAYEEAVTAFGHASRRGEAFGVFVRLARVLRILEPDDFAIATCVSAATRASCMLRLRMTPSDAELERELSTLVEPHQARHASTISTVRRQFGLR